MEAREEEATEERPQEQNAGTLRDRKRAPLEQEPAGLGLRLLHFSIMSPLLHVKIPPDLYPLNPGSQRRPGTTVGPPNPKTGRFETSGKTQKT